MPEKPKPENAKTEIFRFWRFVFPHAPSNLVSPFGRDVAQRQRGLGSLVRELDLPQAKTEGVLQIDKIRLRLALTRTCPCAAPSVTACAVPPSSGRKALVFRTIQLVSPSGRDVAQRQRGLISACTVSQFALTRTCQRAALSVICFANASSPKGRAEKPERTAHMPHQAISCADLPAYRSFPRLR